MPQCERIYRDLQLAFSLVNVEHLVKAAGPEHFVNRRRQR
jgi:hypothetical protein